MEIDGCPGPFNQVGAMKLWSPQNIDISEPPATHAGLHLSVRICGSGEPIVFSDPTLWQICKRFFVVSDTPLTKLRQLVHRATGRSIKTLAEVFERYATRYPMFLELKSFGLKEDNIEQSVTDLLLKHYPNANVRLTDCVLASDSLLSFCKLHYLFGDFRPLFVYRAKSSGRLKNMASNLLLLQGVLLDDRQVAAGKLNKWSGRQICVGPVNGLVALERLAALGVTHAIASEAGLG